MRHMNHENSQLGMNDQMTVKSLLRYIHTVHNIYAMFLMQTYFASNNPLGFLISKFLDIFLKLRFNAYNSSYSYQFLTYHNILYVPSFRPQPCITSLTILTTPWNDPTQMGH